MDKSPLNLGGNIDRALSGDYELNPIQVFKEAWHYTLKNPFTFLPGIWLLLFVQFLIFFAVFSLNYEGELNESLLDNLDEAFYTAVFIANFTYEIVGAPLYASMCLMALTQVCGLKLRFTDLMTGFQFTIALLSLTGMSLFLQLIGGKLIPLLSFYIILTLSNAVFLICEKKQSPFQAMYLSFRSINKKILPILGIYTMLLCCFILALSLYGIGLLLVLPLMFNVKAIIYRNMFGVGLNINQKQTDNGVLDA